jgi:hypothetical protein
VLVPQQHGRAHPSAAAMSSSQPPVN